MLVEMNFSNPVSVVRVDSGEKVVWTEDGATDDSV